MIEASSALVSMSEGEIQPQNLEDIQHQTFGDLLVNLDITNTKKEKILITLREKCQNFDVDSRYSFANSSEVKEEIGNAFFDVFENEILNNPKKAFNKHIALEIL